MALNMIVGNLNSKTVNWLVFLQKMLNLAFSFDHILCLWKQNAKLSVGCDLFALFEGDNFFFRLEEVLGDFFHSCKNIAFGPLRPTSEKNVPV